MKRKLILLLMIAAWLPLMAETLRVTGTVTSADDGEPLIGASVRVKQGTNAGVVTDIDGNYSIDVEKGKTLVFSYIGFEPAERKIDRAGSINVVLGGNSELDELVVIGYGAMKKSDLTGSVASVAGEDLQRTPSASLANALQGQAAGVSVNSLSGRPGAAAEVRIRGIGTIGDSNPIYVVDGVITDDISFVSPNDIESTEILKDASATAIYGSRGANGVIIVTTRSGSKNKRARITLDGYLGFQSRYRKLDVMDSSDFARTLLAINGTPSERKVFEEQGMNRWLQAFKGVGSKDYFPAVYDAERNPGGFDYSSQNTDWQDEVFRTGMIQNYHLSIDGSGENFTYSASGSWFKQEGTVIGSGYSRTTARLNTSYQATPWLRIGENISFMASVSNNIGGAGDNTDSAGSSILSAALAMAPWDPVRYPEGTLNRKGNDIGGNIAAASNFKNVTNPFSMVEYSHPKERNERFVGNAFIELTPLKHFTFKSTFNFDYSIWTKKEFKDAHMVNDYDNMPKNFLVSNMSRTFNYVVDNILTYNQEFGRHYINAMVGQTVEEYSYYGIGGSGANILNPVDRNWFLSNVTEDYGRPSDSVGRNRRFSWLGRLHYSYDNRYMATVNFRADGSSKFKEKKWGYFPSFALAWRADNENFLRDVNWVSQLKLRFGWGRVGNDKISNDAFLLKVHTNGPTFVDYVFGSQQTLAQGAAVLTWINNGGHWENTEQWNLGIDFGFWNNRLTGTVEGFIRDTNDMLMSVNTPAYVGNRYAPMANVGKVRNKGIELSLNHQGAFGNGFSYSVGGNITFLDNKLLRLNGGSPAYYGYEKNQIVNEGFPLYYFNVLQYEGVYRSDEEVLSYLHGYDSSTTPYHAGDARFRDVNGDGRIDESDRVDSGSVIPKINYGLNLTLGWKGLDLQMFFQGAAGNKIYNQMRHRLESNGVTSVLSPVMADAWTPENTSGSIPNPKNSVNYQVSDRFLEDGSYFRMKDLQLGYSLPQKWVNAMAMSSVRFYVQASNLFTVTKYKGYDPEVNGGIDYGNYPQARTFLFGFNITY